MRNLRPRYLLLQSVVMIGLLSLGSLAGLAARLETGTRPAPSAAIAAEELARHIKYLASDELEGRRSGTPGCEKAANYISDQFKKYGLKPSNGNGYLQPFDFIAGVRYGEGSSLKAQVDSNTLEFRLGEDYHPLNFSSSSAVSGELVLAGYGISASSIGYDDYAKIDVKDKIVMVLPFSPEGTNLQGRFGQFLAIRRKAHTARERGARAILFVSEADNLNDAPRRPDNDYTDAGIVAIRISRRAANELLKSTAKTVQALTQSGSEKGVGESFVVAGPKLSVKAELTRESKATHNVIGIVEGSDERLKGEFVVIGAHYDHLGTGGHGSLAGDSKGIHYGADDNASGVAGLLELARVFAANRGQLRRSIVFAAFSGEEEGLLGSSYYVNKQPLFPIERTVAMLNMDMIGRMRQDNLAVFGIGTSPQWKTIVEELNKTRGFVLKLNEDGFGPSDHSSFYAKDIPVLHFFTGVHDDYHKPTDTADRINIISEQAVVSYIYDIAARVNRQDERLAFSKAQSSGQGRAMNSSFRVSLGTVPEYAEGVEGVKLSGVRPDSPADKAGVKAGDIIVQLAGKNVKSVQDYVFVLQEMKPNEPVVMVVVRDGKRMEITVTPTARQ